MGVHRQMTLASPQAVGMAFAFTLGSVISLFVDPSLLGWIALTLSVTLLVVAWRRMRRWPGGD